ncbi:Maf family protein [Vallitalea okinawensis]|uniref:Maf family protein n=1 Tax=Vallitalea okinawensis TaxID=2078660 RepID=UPI000CFB763E|nr:Maf family protein [Vallitalea okinawensis]
MRKKIILASQSPRRKELLELLQIDFEILSEEVEESYDSNMSPEEIVEYLAFKKAKAVAENTSEKAVIIGSDTIVELDGEILLKPKDIEDAILILKRLSGKKHRVYTGLAIIDLYQDKKIVTHDCTEVLMAELTEEEIKFYIDTKEPMDKAGAYGIQGIGSIFVEKINGDFFNVMGLPLRRLYLSLDSLGISLPKMMTF